MKAARCPAVVSVAAGHQAEPSIERSGRDVGSRGPKKKKKKKKNRVGSVCFVFFCLGL